MSKSAGINFGIPDSEYIVRVDDSGAATSCYNQDTDTEYIGGGGGGGGETCPVENYEIWHITIKGVESVNNSIIFDQQHDNVTGEMTHLPKYEDKIYYSGEIPLSETFESSVDIISFADEQYTSMNILHTDDITISTSGGITFDTEYAAFIITGSGTITITAG